MDRAFLPSAAAFILVIGVSCLGIAGSIAYVGTGVWRLVEASAQSSASDGPDFVAGIEPVPAGSLSAIVPLPASSAATAPPAQPAAPIQQVEPVGPSEVVASADPGTIVAPPTDSGDRMVATISVNVRDRPSNDSRVIGTLPSGAAVAILASHQGWMQISDGSRNGWVYGRYLRAAR